VRRLSPICRIISLCIGSLIVSLLLGGCGGGGGGGNPVKNFSFYSIGGNTTGLAGTLVLQNNSGDNLTVTTDGNFSFATSILNGNTYDVSIYTQPLGQTCTVSSGAGTVSGSDINDVAVVCTTNTYSVGGTISGLTGTVLLQNNSGDNLTVTANGSFTFTTPVASGSIYIVSVFTQPAGQTCSVSTGAGIISGNNVNNVSVVCSTNAYTVGGTVSGLTGSVVLQNNLGDNLTVTIDGNFTFATPVASGSPYSVTVLTQPSGLNCSVASGTGTVTVANVSNVSVTCGANTFTIGGTVTGLNGSMVLQNNGGDDLTISTNGSFSFAASVANGNPYAVTLLSQQFPDQCDRGLRSAYQGALCFHGQQCR